LCIHFLFEICPKVTEISKLILLGVKLDYVFLLEDFLRTLNMIVIFIENDGH